MNKDEKFGKLEGQMEAVQGDLTDIKTNHLVHIYDRLGSIEKKMAYYMGGLAILVFVLDIIFRFIK